MNFLGQLNWGSKPCAPTMNIKASPKIFCIMAIHGHPWPTFMGFNHGSTNGPWLNFQHPCQLTVILSKPGDAMPGPGADQNDQRPAGVLRPEWLCLKKMGGKQPTILMVYRSLSSLSRLEMTIWGLNSPFSDTPKYESYRRSPV